MISIGNLQINKLFLGNLEVAKAYLGDVQVYGSTPQPVEKYMTMTVLDGEAGTTISPTVTGKLPNLNLQYRINNGEWSDFIVGTTADIKVVAGDAVQFKGVNESGISASYSNYLNFAVSGNHVALSGNVMSLIDGVGDTTVIPRGYCFFKLFSTSNVKTVSSDFLHATTLANNCYNSMFSGCTSLVTAPALPATKLANSCYSDMFRGCTSLVNAPALPATKLANSCYGSMFSGCTSLATAPELPATTLADYCYAFMFKGCTSLTTAPELPVTTLALYCYEGMFSGCTSLTTAPVLPATTLAGSCYSSMFERCTSLTTAPVLPATTLANYCYSSMFERCTSLTTAPELTATTLSNNCYNSMFSGCTSLTTAPTLNATTLAGSCYQRMFKNCNNLNYVKCLATEITATNALYNWLEGVASTGTFVKSAGVSYPTGVSGIPEGWTVEEIVEPEGKYMTITVDDAAAGETTISPTVTGSLPNLNLQYRINNREWNDFIVGTTADIQVVAGDFVQWKGNNPDGVSASISNRLSFSISGNPVHLSGNVMSLIDSKGETLVIPNNFCFNNLFESPNIKTVSSDFLPATTLTQSCYLGMFGDCTALENSPELPATTLSKGCYSGMFRRCTSLKNTPELPATTLADSCYNDMFYGCTALTTAPALPATTLANNCYYGMLEKCTALTTAPELPAMTLAYGCYSFMFRDCTSLTTAPELPATTLANYCYDSMFYGCTALTTAPALPATTLAERCYYNMLYGCSSLVSAPVLPATTLANLCYNSMFQECTSLTTAPQLPATTLVDSCYEFMFYGCTALTTAPALPATTLANNCYFSMFSGCTALVNAPELPATTLADSCYNGMFQNCKNMNYVKCLATDITATNALKNWLANVARTGTFVKPAGVTYQSGNSGIPEGWTVEEIVEPTQEKYMTITVDGNAGETIIKPTVTGSLPNLNLQYRINNGEWSDFIVGTTADIQVVAGDVVQFKGVNESGLSIDYDNYLNFAISGNPVALSGNIMSLIDGVGETLVIPNNLCFYYLFYTSEIKTVSSDFLPATTLKEECYRSLFAYCRNLTQAPALPATTLAPYCYSEMFGGCTALKQAPELPATNLVDNCYNYMFIYCSSLNYVKCLATDNISTSTIFGWLSGVSSTGTFVKPAGVSYETGDSGIPSGWTIQNI